jgi:hypothetical protein
MKPFILLTIALLFDISMHAQAPNKMSYQMVVRNSSNAIIANQAVGVRVSILQALATGIAVFAETQSPATNVNGLASFIIGDGTLVSGSFASIDWGNGPYFIKTEVDPAGGTNYTITSTTQLLSVPYALHAGSAPTQGKPYIILQGKLTNAEAAAIIAADAGPVTQFVWIHNTTALTQVDLSSVTNLVGLKVVNNMDLAGVTAPSLKTVSSDFQILANPSLSSLSLPVLNKLGIPLISSDYPQITGNSSLQTLNFPSLVTTESEIDISNNALLASVSFPALQTSEGLVLSGTALLNLAIPTVRFLKSFSLIRTGLTVISEKASLSILSNAVLTSMSFPELTSNVYGILITDNLMLNSINFPKLFAITDVLGTGKVVFQSTGNPLLSTIFFPVLATVAGTIQIVSSSNLSSVSFPALQTVTTFSLTGTGLNSLSLPQLRTVTSLTLSVSSLNSLSLPQLDTVFALSVSGTSVTALSFLQLRRVGQILSVVQNSNLQSISFPLLQQLGADVTTAGSLIMALNGNKLPSANINTVLAKLVSITPLIVSRRCELKQAVAAPPTGQGITDKAILVARPNTVNTD